MQVQRQDSQSNTSNLPTRTTASGNSQKKCFKLFVGGVPVEFDDAGLHKVIRASIQGDCVVRIVRNPEQGNSKGCAMVELKSKEDFVYLIKNKVELNGRLLQVDEFIEDEEKKKKLMLENNKKTIHVGGLAPEVSELDLKQYFSQFGPVNRAYIVFHLGEVKRSRGFGFVEFDYKRDARKVLDPSKVHMILGKEVTITQKKTKRDLKKDTESAITPVSKGNGSQNGKNSVSGSLSNMGSVSANAHSKGGYSLPADKKSVKTLGSAKPHSTQQYYGGYPPSFVTPPKMNGIGAAGFPGHQYFDFPPGEQKLGPSGQMTKSQKGSSSSHAGKSPNHQLPEGAPRWDEMPEWDPTNPQMFPGMGPWNHQGFPPFHQGPPRGDINPGKQAPPGLGGPGNFKPPGFQGGPEYQGNFEAGQMPQMPNYPPNYPPPFNPNMPYFGDPSNPAMKNMPFPPWAEGGYGFPGPADQQFQDYQNSTVKSLPYKYNVKPENPNKTVQTSFQKQMQKVMHLPPDYLMMQQQKSQASMRAPGMMPGPAPPGFGPPMNFYPPNPNYPMGMMPGHPMSGVHPYPGPGPFVPPNPAGDARMEAAKGHRPQQPQPVRVFPGQVPLKAAPGPSPNQPQGPPTRGMPAPGGAQQGADTIDMNSFMKFLDNDQEGSDGDQPKNQA